MVAQLKTTLSFISKLEQNKTKQAVVLGPAALSAGCFSSAPTPDPPTHSQQSHRSPLLTPAARIPSSFRASHRVSSGHLLRPGLGPAYLLGELAAVPTAG